MELIEAMRRDMGIMQYEGEPIERYYSRLIYSATSHWLRYAILDETLENRHFKSKIYLHNRGHEILDNFLEYLPICRTWMYEENTQKKKIEDPIKNLRDKMQMAGELIEVDTSGNIGLPLNKYINEFDEWTRIIGLTTTEEVSNFVGVTRIIENKVSNAVEHNFINHIESQDFLNWLYGKAKWFKCEDIEKYEIFNPYSRKPPYQSWSDKVVDSVNKTLGRISLINEMHEYFLLLKQEDEWYCCKLHSVLKDYKEERRAFIALRKYYGNPIEARYSDRNTAIILNLYCGLPVKEKSLLETYCWPLNGISDSYNYVIPQIVWHKMQNILSDDLGIVLKEQNYG